MKLCQCVRRDLDVVNERENAREELGVIPLVSGTESQLCARRGSGELHDALAYSTLVAGGLSRAFADHVCELDPFDPLNRARELRVATAEVNVKAQQATRWAPAKLQDAVQRFMELLCLDFMSHTNLHHGLGLGSE